MTQQPSSQVHRVADVQLRGRAGPLAARAYWPVPLEPNVAPGLLVLLPGDGSVAGLDGADPLCRGLSSQVGVVVLAVSYRPPTPGAADAEGGALQDAITATDWAADHAGELGADPRGLVVAGEGTGGDLAAAVARHARSQGWPPIRGPFVIDPDMRLEDLARSLRNDAGARPARPAPTGRHGSAAS